MSTKIKQATLISNVGDSIKLPVGNYEDDNAPYAVSIGQLKSHIDSDKATVATTGSYNDLNDLPNLNDYAQVSTLNSNYYNKIQINDLLGQIHGTEFRVVQTLPEKGEEGIIYLVKDNEQPEQQNYFDEYIWLPEYHNYERIGDTQTDLSQYYTKTQVDALIPSVSNSQITLQQNGLTVGSFRLNQNNGATINFSLPSFEQVQTDWSETDTTSPKYIWHKPTIPTVNDSRIKFMMNGTELGAFSTNQSTDDTIVIPATSQIQTDWNQSDNTKPDFIKNKPTIPLVNNPTIYFTQGGVTKGSITLNQSGSATIAFDAGGSGGGGSSVQSNWTDNDPTSMAFIQNKPTFATVATSGSYNDLSNKPTISNSTITIQQEGVTKGSFTLNQSGSATINLEGGSGGGGVTQVQSNWTEADTTAVSYIQNKPSLSTVATSGSYNDLLNKPTIPAAQVNVDWNSNSGVTQILHRPVLATVATSGSYSDLSNKPTIPSNTRSLLITYDDQSTETIVVYTT